MSRMFAALLLASLGLGCGQKQSQPTWTDCYRGMTNNYQNQSVDHVDHCDSEMGVTHACQDACRSYHKDQGIAQSVLDQHCNGIIKVGC